MKKRIAVLLIALCIGAAPLAEAQYQPPPPCFSNPETCPVIYSQIQALAYLLNISACVAAWMMGYGWLCSGM